LEKGPTSELIWLSSKEIAERRVGKYITEGQCPDAIYEYYKNAAGAGGIVAVRATDGNEVAAQKTIYTRNSSALVAAGTITAHNGGRWGGKRKRFTTTLNNVNQVTETILSLGATESPTVVEGTFKPDEYNGGYIQFGEVGSTQYKIISSAWNDGNSEWDFTVTADSTMSTDLGATPTDMQVYLTRENEAKAVSFRIRDGEEDPDNEFAIDVYVDGNLVTTYANLSMDDTSSKYWVNIINDDTANYEIVAADSYDGAIVPAARPSNGYSKNSAVTATTLTAIGYIYTINSPGGGDPTHASVFSADNIAQTITITMTSATEGNVVSDVLGAIGTCTLGSAFDSVKWVPAFTITAGETALSASDTIVLNYILFEPDELVGGYLYPDKTNSADAKTKFRITANTNQVITVADGSDMTAVADTSDDFMVVAPIELEGGRDGASEIADADYTSQLWDVDTSPFNQIADRNMGLVKFATPGVTATAVQNAGKAYADAKNHQYRCEIPSNVTTDDAADTYVNTTIGRSTYSAWIFPSYAYMADPEGNNEGALKLVTVTGMVHGREARMAVDNFGYHKAAAGVEATLPSILKLPTGDRILDQEILNPRGIPVIIKKQGNFVIWGDRIPATDPTWRWKHQREAMSYYEHVLQESFDWIIFSLNNVRTQQLALASLRGFFREEYNNGAFDTAYTFEEAVLLKVDGENNTDVTKEAGDLYADIRLRMVGTVERFKIRIGKAGIFEASS